MVLLFLTTQSALRAEEILLEAGVAVDVVPRPEGVPGGLCGLALDVVPEELADADYLLAEAEIEFRLFDGSTPAEPGAGGGSWSGRADPQGVRPDPRGGDPEGPPGVRPDPRGDGPDPRGGRT